MVSGFFTSPWLHCRMWSAVARPIRSSSKTLTSSKISYLLWQSGLELISAPGPVGAGRRRRLDLFDGAGLEAAGQVDAEFLGGAVHVVVGVAHLDGHAVAGEHLDVEAQRLQLLEQHLERLRDAGLRDVLALDDGLVDLHP